MADEPQDPSAPSAPSAESIKEASVAMQELGAYSKQLAEAIQNSVKSMEKYSELSQAIQEQTKKIAEYTEQIQKKSLEDKQTTERKKSDVADMYETTLKTLTAKESLSESELDMLNNAKLMLDLKKEELEIQTKWTKDADKRKRAQDAELGFFSAAIKSAKELNDNLARSGDAGKLYGRATGTASEIITGKSELTAGIGSIGSAISGLMPSVAGIGGLIGLMLAGKMKEAEFQAIGQTAAQQFDQISGHTAQFASRLGNAARELSTRAMAAKEDLYAVSAAFAQTGVSAAQAQSKIAGFKSIVGNDLVIAALAADKALELPAGTFAKMSGTLATNFNTSAKEAFTSLMNIGQAAKEAGLNAAQFMHQTMEASSALRLLNANGEAVGQMQLKFAQSLKNSGMGTQFAGAYAAAGTQSMAQSIAGLGVGMSAVVGERMNMGSGLDAWYAMKSGTKEAHAKQLDPGAIAAELAKMARETGKTKAEQVYFLTQLTGTSVGGAEAIMSAGEEYKKNGGKLSKDSEKALNTAFTTESEKTSDIVKNLEIIKDGILHIGTGMLAIVISTLKLIWHSIQVIAGIIGGDKDKVDAYDAAMSEDLLGMKLGVDRLGLGLSKVGEGIKGELGAFGLDKGWNVKTKDSKERPPSDDATWVDGVGWVEAGHASKQGKITKKVYSGDGEHGFDVHITPRSSKAKRYKQTGK